MTPKEKAKELVDKFLVAYDNEPIAIKSALIAVNELLDATKRQTYNQNNWNDITGFRYDKFWLQVKYEIEKL